MVNFDILEMLARIEDAIKAYPRAALFELADEGYNSAFEQLIACMISIRTLDEVTLPTARRLFAVARTPAALAELPVERIDALIGTCTFHEQKARQMHAIAVRCRDEFDGALPCSEAALLSLPGVGPKCANLVLGIACGVARIGVDVHVHRVCNRWGLIATRTPEESVAALEAVVPRELYVTVNRVLMPFGKFVCTGKMPHCSTCPVRPWCRQVGVTSHQ